MDIEDREIIYTSVVVVFDIEGARPRLSVETLKKIIRPPLAIGMTGEPSITVVSSPRDQIDILLGQGRLQVRDNSGREPGKKPVSKIVLDTLMQLGGKHRALGFNYGLAFRLRSGELPAQLIKDKMLNTKFLGSKIDTGFIGTSIKLQYPKGSKTCNLSLEPYENPESERFHIDLNVHEDITTLPPHDALEKSFKIEYSDLMNLLASL